MYIFLFLNQIAIFQFVLVFDLKSAEYWNVYILLIKLILKLYIQIHILILNADSIHRFYIQIIFSDLYSNSSCIKSIFTNSCI